MLTRVTEQELSAALHLSPKLVREILHRLRMHQLVRGMQKSDSLVPKPDELTSRGRRKGFVRAPPVVFTWHVDFEHVVKVIQFRHSSIIAQLNPKGQRSSTALFACPTPTCHNHRRVLDFLKGDVEPDAQGQFRCTLCFTKDPLTGATQPTALQLVAQEADPLEDKKKRFNAQLKPIQDQLKIVVDLLEKERREGNKAGAGAAAAAAAAAASGQTQRPDFAAAHAAAAAAAAAAGAAAAAAGRPGAAGVIGAPVAAPAALVSIEDMIQVNLTGSASGAGSDAPSADAVFDPAAKRQRAAGPGTAAGDTGDVFSALASGALPWDRNAPGRTSGAGGPLSLARMEEERRLAEERSSAAQEEARRKKIEEETQRFKKEYDEQLAKQQASAAAAAAAAASAAAAAAAGGGDDMDGGEEQEEETILLGGRAVPLSSIRQEDIDMMTEEEFEAYSNRGSAEFEDF
jgi:transcription initiation factor IIE alpha subunit